MCDVRGQTAAAHLRDGMSWINLSVPTHDALTMTSRTMEAITICP